MSGADADGDAPEPAATVEPQLEGAPQDSLEDSPEETPPKREGLLGVLGIAFGLLFLLSMVLSVVGIRAGELDGEAAQAKLADLFEDGSPPPGYVLDSLKELPTRERVLRLVLDGEATAAVGEEDQERPIELLFLEYPSSKAVKALFAIAPPGSNGEKMLEWEADPSNTFHATRERGELTWGAWLADYAVVRAFAEDETWSDSARVNLSQPGRYLALFCQWPPGVPSSEDQLKEILATVQLLEDEVAGS